MSQLNQDTTVIIDDSTMKYYLGEDGLIRSFFMDSTYVFFNDIGTSNLDDALTGLQGMMASRGMRDLETDELRQRYYAEFGPLIERSEKL